MSPPYDVLVAGGGPAGCAAAITLARAGRRVLLVDPAPPGDPGADDFKVGEGLPGAARRLLKDLGVLDAFLADGHLPSYGNQSAWGSPELRTLDLIRAPEEAEAVFAGALKLRGSLIRAFTAVVARGVPKWVVPHPRAPKC